MADSTERIIFEALSLDGSNSGPWSSDFRQAKRYGVYCAVTPAENRWPHRNRADTEEKALGIAKRWVEQNGPEAKAWVWDSERMANIVVVRWRQAWD